jgi:probable phosphoglycerate mutase
MVDFVGFQARSVGRIFLLRHGQTAWSVSGQHTGRTDVPLTAEGERQAIAAGERLRDDFREVFGEGGIGKLTVYTSPLSRARRTAELAGFGDYQVLDGIAEWDYGRAEGRTREMLSEAIGRPWNLWADGPQMLPTSLDGEHDDVLPDGRVVHVHNGYGESADEVYARVSSVIDSLMPRISAGEDVLLVAHAHVLRILTSCWVGAPVHFAKQLKLDTGHFAMLSDYKGDHVIEKWNC